MDIFFNFISVFIILIFGFNLISDLASIANWFLIKLGLSFLVAAIAKISNSF